MSGALGHPDATVVRSPAAADLAWVDLAGGLEMNDYVVAARRLAAELIRIGLGMDRSFGFVQACRQRVAELALDELIADREAIGEPVPLVFLTAEALGHATVDAAWAGLLFAPLVGALNSNRSLRCGPPVCHAALSGSSSTWVALSPMGAPISRVLLVRPEHGGLAGPIDPDNPPAGFSIRRLSGLLGLPQAEMLEIRHHPQQGFLRTLPLVTDIELPRFVSLTVALLGGLIGGATRRLVDEAYSYAKTRQSGGRALIQHQAVGLRLADLAINQQALHLYLLSCLGRAGGDSLPHAGHVQQLAFAIARDAVQIAGAHGYVEGLPFKRLFEQVRSLTSVFSLAVGNGTGAAPTGGWPG